MSADLHSSGKSSFYSNVMRMSEYYNLRDFDPNVLNKSKNKHYIRKPNATQIYPTLATYYSTLYKKLKFCNTFKNEYSPSCYLELTSKLNAGKEIISEKLIQNRHSTE